MVQTKTKTLVELICKKDKFLISETKKQVDVKPVGAPELIKRFYDITYETTMNKITTRAPKGADAFIEGRTCSCYDRDLDMTKSCIPIQYYKIKKKQGE